MPRSPLSRSSRRVLPVEALVEPLNRWDLAVEVILGLLLAFMPLAFGAVEAWSELVVVTGAAALVLLEGLVTAQVP